MTALPDMASAGDTLSGSISEQIRGKGGEAWVKFEASVTVLGGEPFSHAMARLEMTLIAGLSSVRETQKESKE